MQQGKNSCRVLSVSRRQQVRLTAHHYVRVVPGDIIELLYDQPAQFAFRVSLFAFPRW